MTRPVVSRDMSELPGSDRRRAVTIGKFDGVHRGHRAIVSMLAGMAGSDEVTIVTFDRHPRELLDPDCVPHSLVSLEQKIELLGEAGADRVVVLPFTEDLASLSHQEFSRNVLSDGLGASLVLVGRDFRYGSGGVGDVVTLAAEGRELGFVVHEIPDIYETAGQRISSTMIRSLLSAGDVKKAASLLGRRPSVRSVVVHGHQRGRDLGYPTANLANPVEGFLPADGVYATMVTVEGESYPAATSIGVNPTFGDLTHRVVESHLLDCHLDLYGKRIEVFFVDYIRPMQKFPDGQALADQMRRDEEQIRSILL